MRSVFVRCLGEEVPDSSPRAWTNRNAGFASKERDYRPTPWAVQAKWPERLLREGDHTMARAQAFALDQAHWKL